MSTSPARQGVTALSARISALSEEQREVLRQRLLDEGVDLRRIPVVGTGGEEFPLSYAQERLWVMEQWSSGEPVSNLAFALELRGRLDAGLLARCVGALVERHGALRTVVVRGESGLRQRVLGSVGECVTVEDLSGLGGEEREREVRRRSEEVARGRFDLEGGPLLRVLLVRLGAEEWRLLVCVHHLVMDGWSLGIFVGELMGLYRSGLEGEEAGLGELGVQYGDYASWQRTWMGDESVDGELGYWREELSGVPVLELPGDRPRPPVQTFRGGVHREEVGRELLDGLLGLGREVGATLFMTLLAGWQVVLGRLSGQEDFAVGAVVGDRRPELEGVVGCFTNILALRAELSGEPSFRELLERVRERTLSGFGRREVPFERVVAELQPRRSASHLPLVQVLFVVQNVPQPKLELPGLELRVEGLETGTSRCDLTLTVVEGGEGLELLFEYNGDLFEAETVERVAGQYRRLLGGAVSEPERSIWELPLLSEAEAVWLEELGRGPEEEVCGSVHGLVEEQAARTPERVALECGGRRLSYRELEEGANRLARHLRRRGLRAGGRVGICVGRSVAMVVGLLGVLKAGGTYVPLDPAHPEERTRWVLEDAGAEMLLSESGSVWGEGFGGEVICLDVEGEWSEGDGSPVGVEVDPESPAYLIYTSGSTGQPKGVLVPHRAVVNLLRSVGRRPGLGEEDTLLAVTTLSFDIAVVELLLPLTVGGRVVVAEEGVAGDGRRLAGELESRRATVLQATPSSWRLLAEAGWTGDRDLRAFCTGEACPRELASWLAERTGSAWNLYGPTETTIWSAIGELGESGGHVALGRPVANTRVHVLDRAGSRSPVGTPGEICIGGLGVALGYHRRPDLTAERFVPDGLGGEPGARLYRTGDLGRWRADGSLEFLGRVDQQLKVRGFRVEPGEVESRLREQAGVREVAVVEREGRLVGYVVAEPGSELAPAELRGRLRRLLPDYMVPAAIVELESLPLTPNRKLDRSRLPAPDREASTARGYVAPRSPVEAEVARLFAELLGVDRVGVDDDFFDLGGHSLLAALLIERLDVAFGLRLSMTAIAHRITVAWIAGVVEHAGSGDGLDPGLDPHGLDRESSLASEISPEWAVIP
jgi:amino acid adenylation domain-containing protein